MEVEFADSPTKPTNKELAYLDKLVSELEKKAGKKRLLLLIDEVQHLATSKSFEALAHALRTILDKRQGRVKSIFTGSSRHYMNLLFNASQSPFYHFVEAVPFPDLDEQFIAFLRDKLVDEHGMEINERALNSAFRDLDRSPYWMMKLISQLVTFKVSIKEALNHVLLLLEAAEGFEAVANSLKPIDKIVFLALCDDRSPFSAEILAKIDKETSVKGVMANVQRSIQRLSDNHLVSQIQRGKYFIEKPGLKRYLVNDHGD